MTNTSPLPQTGFLRLPAILGLIPIGKSTWWAGVKSGRFPKPVKLGPHTTAWRAEDINAIIRSWPDSSGAKPGTIAAAAMPQANPPLQSSSPGGMSAIDWVNRVAK